AIELSGEARLNCSTYRKSKNGSKLMGWVDADAHVVESPLTWEYLLPSERKFRPELFKPEGEAQRAHWVIDGKIRGLFRFTFTAEDLMKKSAQMGRDMTT